MTTFKYVCIPVKSEEEGIEAAEDLIGSMLWNNDEHKRPQAWPYDNDNPIIVMDSPLSLETQLADARAEIERKNEELDMFLAEQQAMNEIVERKDALIEQMKGALKIVKAHMHETGDFYALDDVNAALLAAERGK